MNYTSLERMFLISSTNLPEFSVTTWVMAIAGLVLFIITSMYIFRRLKEDAREEPYLGPNAILSKFRDMRDNGALSEEEFRKIKLILAEKIVGEEKKVNQE